MADISTEEYSSMVFEDGGSLVVNLDAVEEMKFEAIPKGIYNALVDSCEYQISKNSGAPMFMLIFEVQGGEYQGRKLYFYASFSPKALSGTKTALLRLDPTLFSGPFKPQEIADQGLLLGKPARIKVTHEDYNGETRARIQAVLAPASDSTAAGGGDGFFGN